MLGLYCSLRVAGNVQGLIDAHSSKLASQSKVLIWVGAEVGLLFVFFFFGLRLVLIVFFFFFFVCVYEIIGY
jgi:hypothetical protein